MSHYRLWSMLGVALAMSTMWLVPACASPPSFEDRVHGAQSKDPSSAEPAASAETTSQTLPDGGAAPAVPDEPSKPGDATGPLKGEVGKWTWFDVPGTSCANGQPTGIAVNMGTGTDLVVFLAEGGACWDDASCNGLDLAAHFEDGYTKTTFDSDLEGGKLKPLHGGIFDRGVANNPYRTSSMVFVPYCTGDVHAGDATQTIGGKEVHFAGRRNLDAFLGKIVPSFKQASRVTLTGLSAGGFGAAIGFWRVQKAFGDVRVDMIDDSGPPFEQSTIGFFDKWKAAWNLDGAFPPDCPACKQNVREVPAYYARTFPKSRFATLSHHHDGVISLFFVQSPFSFSDNLDALNHETLAPLANHRFFVVTGVGHMMLFDLTTDSYGVDLGGWLDQMKTDSPDWKNADKPQ